MFLQIVFIIIGVYFLVMNAIFGNRWGKAAKSSEKMNSVTTRIIYAIAGLILIGYGIIAITNPGILPNR